MVSVVVVAFFPVNLIFRMILKNRIAIPKYIDDEYGSGGFIFTFGDFHASVVKHALGENPGPQPCLHPWCA